MAAKTIILMSYKDKSVVEGEKEKIKYPINFGTNYRKRKLLASHNSKGSPLLNYLIKFVRGPATNQNQLKLCFFQLQQPISQNILNLLFILCTEKKFYV